MEVTDNERDAPVPAQAGARMINVFRYPRVLWQLLRESVSAWVDDYAPSMGAAISYYTVFSIAPLLLIVIAVAGLALGREAATGHIFDQLRGLLGDAAAAAIEAMVQSASQPGKSVIATAIGVVTLALGATTVFGELQNALDRIWKAPAAQEKEGLGHLLRSRMLSFGLILGIGFLLLVSLVVSAALAALGNWWAPLFGGFEALLHAANLVFSFLIVTALFAMIYKWLPRADIGWHDVWIGAAATALLFSIGKLLIGLYIGKSSVVSGFGAAGSLAVMLVWVYYSAQIFLLGAEFTWVYAYRYGSRKGQDQPAGRRALKRATEKRRATDNVPASAAQGLPPAPAPAGASAVAAVAAPSRRELRLAAALGVAAVAAAVWLRHTRRRFRRSAATASA